MKLVDRVAWNGRCIGRKFLSSILSKREIIIFVHVDLKLMFKKRIHSERSRFSANSEKPLNRIECHRCRLMWKPMPERLKHKSVCFISCFSQLKVYSTRQGPRNKRCKAKDIIVPLSFQYVQLYLRQQFQSILILSLLISIFK